VFGFPRLHEDDALRAVRAAAGMNAALGELSAELERDHGVGLAARIGVNTGEVVAGDPRIERERVRRRDRIGKASADTREAPDTTPARTTLACPREDRQEPPEPGALGQLARVLVDVAVALEHDDGEDERWTR
jgi:hypothetical protein